MIALRAVTKRYGDHVVLDGFDLDLPHGTVTALTGRNGCGKTTVARLLLGLTAPDDGVVTGLAGLRRAAVFQENRLCEQLSAVANVRLVLGRGTAASVAADQLQRLGLGRESFLKPVRELSGGQRRTVAIARALVAEADLVVLDEPFTGLDTEARATVMAVVREHGAGRTMLLITHEPGEVAWFGASPVVMPGRTADPDGTLLSPSDPPTW